VAGQKEEEIQKEVIEERQEGDQRKEGKTFKEGTRKAGERGTTCTCKEGKGTVGQGKKGQPDSLSVWW